ncbi:MAG: urease accessory protein UreD [Ketobacteraceae bacterium]|nr:urease accessory protein UreD [Ketobacteraceae bacterium]
MNASLNANIKEPCLSGRSWHASLSLGFESRASKNVLTRREHCGPLRVQRAFYPEGPAIPHVYLLHPPGGVVGGDTLAIDIRVEKGSAGLVTTPSAGRVYRTAGAGLTQLQQVQGTVNDNALLEWLPQENIIFNGANGINETRFDLSGSASLVAWDICCLGRPAGNEPFVAGHFIQSLKVFRSGNPLLLERFAVNGESGIQASQWGLRGFTVFGTMVATLNDPEVLRAMKEELQHAGMDYCLAYTQKNDLLIARYLGHSAIQARHLFSQSWQRIRPSIADRPACEPRIWHT